jgi:hypothetical protein
MRCRFISRIAAPALKNTFTTEKHQTDIHRLYSARYLSDKYRKL